MIKIGLAALRGLSPLPLALLVLLWLPFAAVQAQVRVVKTAGDGNPKLFIGTVAAPEGMAAVFRSNLAKCGWFDIVADPRAADYQIEASAEGNSLTVRLGGAAALGYRVPFDHRGDRQTANAAVDHLLRSIFKIPGICASRIAFSTEVKPGYKEIFIANFDGSEARRITSNNDLSVEPSWTPGNRSVVYTMYRHGNMDVVEYELASRRSRRLSQFPGLNTGAAVSPNGQQMAVVLSKDGVVDLYLREVGGQGLRRLTNDRAVEASPSWSPDGSRIVFVSDRRGRPNLFVTGTGGGSAKPVPTLGSEAVSPGWSADGKIVYSARIGGAYTLAVTDLAGGKAPERVIEAAGDWESPSWAPDNRHVVCVRTIGGKSSLHVVDTWTGAHRQIFASAANMSTPNWSGLDR